jgi:hypothetical protein
MTWTQFLDYLQDPGIMAAAGVVFFLIFEYGPKIKVLQATVGRWAWIVAVNDDPQLKRLVLGAIAVAIPLVAYGLDVTTGSHDALSWSTGVWPRIWTGVTAGLAMFGTSTVVHATVMSK